MTRIQIRAANDSVWWSYGEVKETEIEKLQEMCKVIFPVINEYWKEYDIYFRFIRNQKVIGDEFHLWV